MLGALELATFNNRGLMLPHWRLKQSYVDLLLEQLSSQDWNPDTVAFEPDGCTLRAIHGAHAKNSAFHELTRLNAILRPARQLLKDDVYVYQFKINLKAAFTGDLWPWHQDYSFWAHEDQMPTPRALTVGIFLDEVTEFNGPMFFIPGSHRYSSFVVDTEFPETSDANWRKNVSADLSYQTERNKVTQLVAQHGIVAPKGPSGTVFFFDSNIVHASPANISPLPRRILFITYNSINNLPGNTKRPEFLVSRDTTPLEPIDDDCEFVEMLKDDSLHSTP
jgi:ectoine hydroxylase